MAYRNTASYPTGGTRFRVEGKDFPGVQTIEGIGGGQPSEIDITTLTSTASEYLQGLPDEGSVTITGVLSPQNPVVARIEEVRRKSEEVPVEIVMGDVPTGKNRTDGSAREVAADVAVTNATLVNTKLTYTTTNDAGTFPGITEGDYVKDGSDYHLITALNDTGGKLVITTDGTTASSADEIDIVRPGVRYSFVARVGTFDKSVSTNEAWRFSLEFRINGSVTTTRGTPDITIS